MDNVMAELDRLNALHVNAWEMGMWLLEDYWASRMNELIYSLQSASL